MSHLSGVQAEGLNSQTSALRLFSAAALQWGQALFGTP